MFLAKEDYAQAVEEFNQALNLDDRMALAWHNRRFAAASQRHYDDAIVDFDQTPRTASLAFNYGLKSGVSVVRWVVLGVVRWVVLGVVRWAVLGREP